MTDRYRKLNPARGPIEYRDRWHAHPAHQPGVGSLVLQVIGAGLLLVALWVAFVYVWSL